MWQRRRRACTALALGLCAITCTWQAHADDKEDAPITCYDVQTGWTQSDFPFCKQMTDAYALHWSTAGGYITFGIALNSKYTYVGVGFSESGGAHGADVALVTRSDSATAGVDWQVSDMFLTAPGAALTDAQQDWEKVDAADTTHGTVVTIRRLLDTCDTQADIPVYPDTDQMVVFTYGSELPYDGNVLGGEPLRLNPAITMPQINTTALANDTSTVNLGNNTEVTYRLALMAQDPPDLLRFSVGTLKTLMPSDPAVQYQCLVQGLPKKLPVGKKAHIIRFEGKASSTPTDGTPSVLVRMTLYACTSQPSQMAADDCGGVPDPACSTPLAFWGPGQYPYLLPAMAGLPLGGPGTAPYVQLVVQYTTDSTQLPVAGVQVNTELGLYYTSGYLRTYDAGVLQLGSPAPLPASATSASTLEDVCPASCTGRLAPANTTLVASYFQMGAAGQSIITRHVRSGQELQPLGSKSHWWPGWQSYTQVLPGSRQLLPGDTLITSCTYAGSSLPATDNACVNYLLYYPAVNGWTTCSRQANSSLAACPLAPSSSVTLAADNSTRLRTPWTVTDAVAQTLQAALVNVTSTAATATNASTTALGSAPLSAASAAALAAALTPLLNSSALAATLQAQLATVASSPQAAAQLPALSAAATNPSLDAALQAWLGAELLNAARVPAATNTSGFNSSASSLTVNSSMAAVVPALLPALDPGLLAAANASLSGFSMGAFVAAANTWDVLLVLPTALVTSADTNFTAYVPPCDKPVGPEPTYYTGAAIAAIICITIFLLIVLALLWVNFARKEDPERQALLSALQQAMLEEAVHHPGLTEEELRVKLEAKVRAQLTEQGVIGQR